MTTNECLLTHRPAFGVSPTAIEQAFNRMSTNDGATVEAAQLLQSLLVTMTDPACDSYPSSLICISLCLQKTQGEHLTETELSERLTSLLGSAVAQTLQGLISAPVFAQSVLGFN